MFQMIGAQVLVPAFALVQAYIDRKGLDILDHEKPIEIVFVHGAPRHIRSLVNSISYLLDSEALSC